MIAWASLCVSLGSIVFGVISKAMQLLTVSLASQPAELDGPGGGAPRASVFESLLQRIQSADGVPESIRNLAQRAAGSDGGEALLPEGGASGLAGSE